MSLLTWFSRDRFAVALLFSGLLLAACLIPAQSDTWWQLRAGEEMWRSGRVMLRDEFTHTVRGQPWPNHEWLTHVLFYGLYSLGGLPLLTLFCAASVTTAWALVFRLTSGPPLARVALTGAGALLSSPAWCLRPQVITLALVAVTLTILVRRRNLWLLPPLFVVWANLHGAVALGGVLVLAAWIAHAVHDRDGLGRFTLVAALCLFATAATPMGFSLWLEIPHSLQRLRDYNVIEWRAPSLAAPGDWPFWGVAAAAGGLAWTRRQSLDSVPLWTALGSTVLLFLLATRSVRNVPPFLVVAIPSIAALLRLDAAGPVPRRLVSIAQPALNAITLFAVAAGGAAFVWTAWRAPLPRLGWEPVTPQAVDAIRACPGRLYNRYDEGGFLIWFVRERPVFLDSRQDPFPPELVRAHIDLERTGDYRALFDRYDIGCALSRDDSPLAQSLARDGWSSLAAGDGWSVFERPASGARAN